MRHYIIGTAGHVDHGKTSLIKALTGIDTDRLAEEKERGITTDLGFAYLDLPHFRHVGIVDVPGHERFVHNMLAGAGGMDLVLLVVAADEGVMPQTREHLDILRVLDIRSGIIVITKIDLMEPELVDLAEEEIRTQVRGTFLENAPVIRTSAQTGEGLETLRHCLDERLMGLSAKNVKAPLRMPIDRVFTVKGYGTVVTGTIVEGQVRESTSCMLYPDGIPVRIRGIQVHSEAVSEAEAGQRVAINIPGIRKEDIRRGHVLAGTGTLTPAMMIDVRLDILESSPFPVRNNLHYRFFLGSAELVGKLVLIGTDSVEPGETCYAQFRFDEPMVAKKGDHFVLRMLSPQATVGGGVVLDADAVKKRRNQFGVAEGMAVKERGNNEERLYQTVLEQSIRFLTLKELEAKGDLDHQRTKNDCSRLLQKGKIIRLPGDVYISDRQEVKLRSYMVRFLKAYHQNHPLQEGMPLQEFRFSLLGSGRNSDADAMRLYWREQKIIKTNDNLVSLYRFQVVTQENDEQIIGDIMRRYSEGGLTPPALETVLEDYRGNRHFQRVLTYLRRSGQLIQLDQRYLMEAASFGKARETLLLVGAGNREITLAGYRDALGTSRKVALALLETFDRQGLIRTDGESRFLKVSAVSAQGEADRSDTQR